MSQIGFIGASGLMGHGMAKNLLAKGHPLAIAAFLTAFYTMRQITLTFLGESRTQEAEHAHETPWTMTAPLVVLAVFAVGSILRHSA